MEFNSGKPCHIEQNYKEDMDVSIQDMTREQLIAHFMRRIQVLERELKEEREARKLEREEFMIRIDELMVANLVLREQNSVLQKQNSVLQKQNDQLRRLYFSRYGIENLVDDEIDGEQPMPLRPHQLFKKKREIDLAYEPIEKNNNPLQQFRPVDRQNDDSEEEEVIREKKVEPKVPQNFRLGRFLSPSRQSIQERVNSRPTSVPKKKPKFTTLKNCLVEKFIKNEEEPALKPYLFPKQQKQALTATETRQVKQKDSKNAQKIKPLWR